LVLHLFLHQSGVVFNVVLEYGLVTAKFFIQKRNTLLLLLIDHESIHEVILQQLPHLVRGCEARVQVISLPFREAANSVRLNSFVLILDNYQFSLGLVTSH